MSIRLLLYYTKQKRRKKNNRNTPAYQDRNMMAGRIRNICLTSIHRINFLDFRPNLSSFPIFLVGSIIRITSLRRPVQLPYRTMLAGALLIYTNLTELGEARIASCSSVRCSSARRPVSVATSFR